MTDLLHDIGLARSGAVLGLLLALGLAGGFCLGASIALLRNRWMKPARRPRA